MNRQVSIIPSMSSPKRFLFVLILVSLCATGALAQQPLFWGGLAKGPHTVGFQSKWISDPSRTYHLPGTQPDPSNPPRPILLNIWYPASRPKGSPMRHREYFNIESQQPLFKAISTKLKEYALEVASSELTGKGADKRSAEENAVLNRVLDTVTASYRDASPAKGKFPLVIYHAGYGSSFEDNAALCEYLASYGFVVVGSAYQELGGSSFNIEGNEGSGQDIRFIIGYCRTMPNVDGNHIGYVGHSGGAHTGIVYQTHAGNRIDATVSLDTTEDYYSLADWRWRPMTDAVKDRIDEMTNPILFCASPEAGFEMADMMKFTPRHIFTVDALNHNDFVTQGSMTRITRAQLQPDSEEFKQKLISVQDRYTKLCEVVRGFLTRYLKSDTSLLDKLMHQYDVPVRMDGLSLSYVPVGQIGPAPYDASKNLPPNPRDIRPLIKKIGAVETAKLLERFKDQAKTAAVYNSEFAFALLFQMVSDGKIDDAKIIFKAYKDTNAEVVEAILGQAKFGKFLKYVEFEEKCYRTLLAVDPENKEAAEGLKAMGKGGK